MPGFFDLLVTAIFVAKDIIDIENVVAILIVVAIVLNAFARFRENAPRILGRFVFECWVAYSVCSR